MKKRSIIGFVSNTVLTIIALIALVFLLYLHVHFVKLLTNPDAGLEALAGLFYIPLALIAAGVACVLSLISLFIALPNLKNEDKKLQMPFFIALLLDSIIFLTAAGSTIVAFWILHG